VEVKGSDHLTAYNVFAEAVNQHGSLGAVYGLPRHVFAESLDEWAERRGVLVKAIEDIAMGAASVYRSLELPLPRTLPYANRELRGRFAELLAEWMPFDLVIDEHTADGQEVRVAKTSVAGSWGAVAGTIRFFADRFGVPRASIEGTTISYELVRRFAQAGPPEVMLTGTRKHAQLSMARRLSYFGFDLETDLEPLHGRFPEALAGSARDTLTQALLDAATSHPDQARVRRATSILREWWRRSGGRLEVASEDSMRRLLRGQLESVNSWESFLGTALTLDPESLVPGPERHRLDALPGMVRVHGDAVALEYRVEQGIGTVRLVLREGQARRLSERDLPAVDRPLHFAVMRSGEDPLTAESLADLHHLLRQPRRRVRGHERRPVRARRGGRRR
jgi:hypothetical protein